MLTVRINTQKLETEFIVALQAQLTRQYGETREMAQMVRDFTTTMKANVSLPTNKFNQMAEIEMQKYL